MHDSPSSHPTISSEERDFIETSIAGSDDKTEVSKHIVQGIRHEIFLLNLPTQFYLTAQFQR